VIDHDQRRLLECGRHGFCVWTSSWLLPWQEKKLHRPHGRPTQVRQASTSQPQQQETTVTDTPSTASISTRGRLPLSPQISARSSSAVHTRQVFISLRTIGHSDSSRTELLPPFLSSPYPPVTAMAKVKARRVYMAKQRRATAEVHDPRISRDCHIQCPRVCQTSWSVQ
jgi:hypothetical protein